MHKISVILLLIFISICNLSAKTDTTAVDSFRFTTIKELPITPVKDQANTGTCWSFSTIGFFEAELLRMGKPEVDLSEMFVVSHSYKDKADKFVRTNGMINFAQGGSFHDVVYVLKNYGIVPDAVMLGLNYGEEKHNHSELESVSRAFVDVIVKNPNKKLSTVWKNAFDGIIDSYLGKLPTEFELNCVKYTPQSYMESLGLNMDDYVSITSFTHQPYYQEFALEIPDNWRWSLSYNIPLNELMEVVDYALENNFPVAWASDVSEKGFTRKGLAVNPEMKVANLPGSDQSKWLGLSPKKIEEKIYKFEGPQQEIKVTPEIRQLSYDNYGTTDDHGMVLFGTAKDQHDTKYYLVKNSWGTDNKYKGIWYASESFVQHKTINILVHKDAIPSTIREKLKL